MSVHFTPTATRISPAPLPDSGTIVAFAPMRSAVQPTAAGLRAALIGTFPPRRCGIATFTSDALEQVQRFHPDVALEVYALDRAAPGRNHDPSGYVGVRAVIDSTSAAAFEGVARSINESACDVVWLQHEFGIFGGPDGELVCDFVDQIAAPLVVTFHTVLSTASANQARIMQHLIARASRIMVMSQHGRRLLETVYQAPAALIEVIPHGAPDRPFGREAQFKAWLGIGAANVLMTFGLLGPGKGIEQVIDALPEIVARHPDTIYRIVGATHPNLLAEQGESYREGLVARARKLGVTAHVEWDNRFLEAEELLDQLEASDIYITPYFNLQQATSGTLSYAVALGKAVVSTPYVHAAELLAGGSGLLVEPDNAAAIGAAVIALLDDAAQMDRIKRRAYAVGRRTIWPEFAAASARMLHAASVQRIERPGADAVPGLSGVFAMCDGTGILQHAIGVVPDRRHGYCLDDNARALILMNRARGMVQTDRMHWAGVFASFVQHAWNPDLSRFRNFMNFDRTWCEDCGSDDSNGRALWALGDTVANGQDEDIRFWARRWFDTAVPAFAGIESPRALAFAMLGAASVSRTDAAHAQAAALLERGGAILESLLHATRQPDWAWFEAVLGYDNPRLPQALIEAGLALGRRNWIDTGLDSLSWIAQRQTAAAGHFRPVGCEGFGREYGQLPFDQQPLEAQAAIEAAAVAFAASDDRRWIDHAVTAYGWFFGANDRGIVLADLASGRCRDGLTPRGRNENCGAESILAFQLAHISMLGLSRQAPTRGLDESQSEQFEPRVKQSLAHS